MMNPEQLIYCFGFIVFNLKIKNSRTSFTTNHCCPYRKFARVICSLSRT